jgi:hypothetical protein
VPQKKTEVSRLYLLVLAQLNRMSGVLIDWCLSMWCCFTRIFAFPASIRDFSLVGMLARKYGREEHNVPQILPTLMKH